MTPEKMPANVPVSADCAITCWPVSGLKVCTGLFGSLCFCSSEVPPVPPLCGARNGRASVRCGWEVTDVTSPVCPAPSSSVPASLTTRIVPSAQCTVIELP